MLSPYPPTNPPTPLPPPSALPRLIKQLPPGYTESQLYDLFRHYGALASARTQTQFGPDIGMVEFWNEEDAQVAEEALHCAEVEGQNIAVQIYHQQRRPSHPVREFNVSAPSFVPSGLNYSPFPTQVRLTLGQTNHTWLLTLYQISILLLVRARTRLFDLLFWPHLAHPRLSYMGQGSKFSWHPWLVRDLVVTVVLSTPVICLLKWAECLIICWISSQVLHQKNLSPEIDSNGLFAHFCKVNSVSGFVFVTHWHIFDSSGK